MKAAKINTKNLKRLCWARGVSVTELADKLQRSRVSLHRAARFPSQYPETYRLMEAELLPTNGKSN